MRKPKLTHFDACPVAEWRSVSPRAFEKLPAVRVEFPDDVAKVSAAIIGKDLQRVEHFILIGVDKSNQIIAIADGTSLHPSQCAVSTSDMIGTLYRSVTVPRNISGVFMSHNHPGGNASPSNEDISMMKTFLCAAEFVPLLDHVIVAPRDHTGIDGLKMFSMRDAFGEKLFKGSRCRLDVDISDVVEAGSDQQIRAFIQTVGVTRNSVGRARGRSRNR